MAASAPQTIICGVTCACAQDTKNQANADAECVAHDSCPLAKNGECTCPSGKCVSSQNKRNCSLARNGQCDCAAGTCKKITEIKQACSSAPNCDCEAGQCKKATLPIS